jgi:hypothetical protein
LDAPVLAVSGPPFVVGFDRAPFRGYFPLLDPIVN